MVFGMFHSFGRSRVGSILIPRTLIIFMYMSTLILIKLNILSWLNNTNRYQNMTEILMMFVTNTTKTSMKGYTINRLF